MKQCYLVVWTVEKIQKVKTQNLENQTREEQMLCQIVHCTVAVK